MTTTLQHLRQLDQQAPPPPWPIDDYQYSRHDTEAESSLRIRKDLEFVWAMRNALPALLDIAEAAERHLRGSAGDEHRDRLREALDRLNT